MTPSVFDQHDILDKLYLELKSSYQKGEIASYDQLLKIAPNLTSHDYEVVIERFKGHIRQQNLMKVSNDTNGTQAAINDDSLESQLLTLQQDFCQKVGLIVAAHEKRMAQVSQGVIEDITSSKIVLEQELKVLQAKYDYEHNALQQELGALKDKCNALQEEQAQAKLQCDAMRSEHEALSLLKLITSEHGIETLEALPFHPTLNSLILELINNTKLLGREQLSALAVLIDNVTKVSNLSQEMGMELSKLSAQKYESIVKNQQRSLTQDDKSKADTSASTTLSEQELALQALKDKFKNIEQLGADNSYFMEDDSFDRHDDPTKEELLSTEAIDPKFNALLQAQAQFQSLAQSQTSNHASGQASTQAVSQGSQVALGKAKDMELEKESLEPAVDGKHSPVSQERIIEILNVIAHDLLAKKAVSELTYQDIGQAIQTAIRMEMGAQDQCEIMGRLLIKVLLLGGNELTVSDFNLSEEELIGLLPSYEQRLLALNTLSWIKNNITHQDKVVDNNPLSSLMSGAKTKGKDSYNTDYQNRNLDSQSGSVEIINSSVPKAIPRDEGTLVREMSQEGGNDNIAAFAAASAKIASLAPLLHEAGKELKQAQKELDADLEKSMLKDRLASHIEENKTVVSSEEEGPLATVEIASVAKDVVKVASELAQGNEERSQKKFSLFDNSHAAAEQTGTTVFGVESVEPSTNVSYDPQKESFIHQKDIDQSDDDESLDDFITGNITDVDQGDSSDLDQEAVIHKEQVEPVETVEQADHKESSVFDQAQNASSNKVEESQSQTLSQSPSTEDKAHNKPARTFSTATVTPTGRTAIIKTTNIDEPVVNKEPPANTYKHGNESTFIISSPEPSKDNPSLKVENTVVKPSGVNTSDSKIEPNKAVETIFDTSSAFVPKTPLDEDGKRRFKFLCNVIDQRINERISKVNILLHGSADNTNSQLQIKDVAWFYQSCISSLDNQGMLTDDLKKALYEKMEYDLKSNNSQLALAHSHSADASKIEEIQPQPQPKEAIAVDVKDAAKVEPEPEQKAEVKAVPEVETVVAPKVEDAAKVEPEPEQKAEVKSASEIKTVVAPKVEDAAKVEPEPEQKAEVKAASEVETVVAPKVEDAAKVEPEPEQKVEVKAVPEVETVVAPKVEDAAKVEPEPEQKAEVKAVPEVETVVAPKVEDTAKVEPEVEPVAYEKITTMVMPDLSKITGKPTIDWDEFNKEKELRAERESIALNEAAPEDGADEADDSANVVPFSFVPKSLKDALSNSQKAPGNNANSPKDLTLEQQMQIRLGLLDMLQSALDKHKKSQGFTVVDDNNDDSLSDDANSQDQSPIVHRHVTFATLNEEELSDDSNLALQDQADVQDSSSKGNSESNQDSTPEGNQESSSDDKQYISSDGKQEAEVSLQVNKDSGEDCPINQADATSNSSADSGSKSASGAAMNEPAAEAKAESRAEIEPKSGTEPKTESVSEPEDDEEILTIIPASEYISDPHKEENLNIPRDFSSMQSFLMGLNTSYNQPKEATFMFQDMNGSQEQLKTAKDDSKDNKK
ncbi:hypothetical protein MXE38_09830 [Anaerobiospirillum sp. NML120448]|uniref:hypothetical protein n=1 Tax=Anaerobiospirillum sp. NML120448 TaxID=2932816 RepID=UPI001FF159D0|nr:hypothetical protein [Anaerobiospirillum sp. NML120448]MCK0515135.1 hypothetical protein [Anaerobiospirillum sp. NML120448]